MQIRRVLVLGATGRIGRILRRCWPEMGQTSDQVIWQARRGGAPDQAVFDPLAAPDALAQAAAGASAILCLSGVTNARAAAGGVMEDNSTLALAAIRAAAKSGGGARARVFLASSAAVYGNQAGALAETGPLAPMSDYGRAKVDMEQSGAALGAELGVPVCALRIGNIAGVDAILGGWRPGFRLDQFKDGTTPQRSYIGPVTLARVLYDLMHRPDLPDSLNIAAPGVIEMGALLDAAGLAWMPQPAPKTAIARVELDITRLQCFTPVTTQDSQPQVLVDEWRSLEPV